MMPCPCCGDSLSLLRVHRRWADHQDHVYSVRPAPYSIQLPVRNDAGDMVG